MPILHFRLTALAMTADAVNPRTAARFCGRNAWPRRISLIFLYLSRWRRMRDPSRETRSQVFDHQSSLSPRMGVSKIKHPAAAIFLNRTLNIRSRCGSDGAGGPLQNCDQCYHVAASDRHNGAMYFVFAVTSPSGEVSPSAHSRVIAAGRVSQSCVSKQDITLPRIYPWAART